MNGNVELFNRFMVDSIKVISSEGKYKVFWQFIQDERLTLISNTEESASNVSKEEADLFLRDAVNQQNETALIDNSLDDDLFADMI